MNISHTVIPKDPPKSYNEWMMHLRKQDYLTARNIANHLEDDYIRLHLKYNAKIKVA